MQLLQVEKTSRVTLANPVSGSIRVTIPSEYAQELELSPGDMVGWKLVEEDGRKILKMRKLKLE